MQWWHELDIDTFRWVNSKLSNPLFDAIMPLLGGAGAGRLVFWPLVVLVAAFVLGKFRWRGLLMLAMLGLIVGTCDGWLCNTIKHVVARDRPFLTLPDVVCRIGRGGSGSMPSSHAANWFAAAMVLLIYARRSLWFTLPPAIIVSFSRVYNGVHYPSDVLAGAILGAGYAAAALWLLSTAWRTVGQKWFPLWWEKFPSLVFSLSGPEATNDSEEEAPLEMPRVRGLAPKGFTAPHVTLDAHWFRLGLIWIFVVLVARLLYIASGTIQLAEDEAYQWLWSKHLALSYFSKPPLIAYVQFLGTSLFGDTFFGVRFFSPVIGAILSFLILGFFSREVNARAGFFLLLIVTATPMAALGSILMTVDPLSVLFWCAAMLAGWRAIKDKSSTADWLWVGLWMGLGFLSKYTNLFQWLCWALFFVLWPPARKQLKRPGPYLALVVNVLCFLPVLIWNWQHGWVTVGHVADDAGVGRQWEPTLRFLGDFLGMELGLLNPIFFIAMIWAGIAMWKNNRRDPRLIYFFSMGAPVFLAYLLHSFKSRILPNWIAPSVLPLFCMMMIYWDTRFRLGNTRVKAWLASGLAVGFVAVIFAHQTDLVGKITGTYLPVRFDPLHRVREWDTTANLANQVRQELLAEGKPVFIITDHYGLAGQFSFYLPEARAAVGDQPLVYFRSSARPLNQFFYWQGYGDRVGHNAIYVCELDRVKLEPAWPSPRLLAEFESVTDLGVRNVMYHGQYLLRPLQFFACRGLKAWPTYTDTALANKSEP
jgi:4-amino-4-deoxy-L-arabinose transferase-like glycosyltransferase